MILRFIHGIFGHNFVVVSALVSHDESEYIKVLQCEKCGHIKVSSIPSYESENELREKYPNIEIHILPKPIF